MFITIHQGTEIKRKNSRTNNQATTVVAYYKFKSFSHRARRTGIRTQPLQMPTYAETPSAEKGRDEEDASGEGGEEHAAYYHPPAPSSELFDNTTTVDPSYTISLIRKLIPSSERMEHGSHHGLSIQGAETSSAEPSTVVPLDRGCCIGGQGRSNTKGTIPNRENSQDILTHDDDMNPEFEHREQYGCDISARPSVSLSEGLWEEYGYILWDLAASENHAVFMVENLLPEVLLASLVVSKSVRVTEICLRILGNLACHEGPRNALSSVNGLVETVINQLFLDDSLCLSGTCWLLMLCLQGSESVIWAKELLPGNVLSRILWIAGNTLNCQLLEKCLELLSTIIESQRIAPILLSSLVELGLSSLLVNLLASEIATLATGKGLDRCSILDSILCAVESLSITSDYSQAVSSNVELFQLICCIIKLPDKIEVADSCITTVVLVANILTDNPNLLPGISKDLSFLHGLLDILPFFSNDSQAKSALWSILARVLSTAEANAMRKLDLQQYAMLLVEKSHIINEDLDDHRGEDFAEDHTDAGKSNAKKGTLRRIANILDSRCDNSQKDASTDANVERLLSYCRNYAR